VCLNYGNKKRFNCIELYNNIKKNFSGEYVKYSFIRNVKIRSIAIENGSVRLKLNLGDIELNNIVLKSSLFDCLNNRFTGNVSFEFKTGLIRSDASFGFSYDGRAEILTITDFVCRRRFLS
jgi:hypothetical protein